LGIFEKLNEKKARAVVRDVKKEGMMYSSILPHIISLLSFNKENLIPDIKCTTSDNVKTMIIGITRIVTILI
jgi:hypothetical protein